MEVGSLLFDSDLHRPHLSFSFSFFPFFFIVENNPHSCLFFPFLLLVWAVNAVIYGAVGQ